MERKMNVGPQAGKTVQVAHPTGRHRVDFRSFCERVAKSTTFNRQEVEAVLNYATRGDVFELKGKGDVPCFCAIPLTDPRPAATACRSRRGEAPEGSSLFRPGVEARSAEDPG